MPGINSLSSPSLLPPPARRGRVEMHEDTAEDGRTALPPSRFDRITIAMHWLSLLLIAVLFATAWSRALAEDAATAGALLSLHRAAGILLWLLTAARLAWRFTAGARPQLVAA